MQAFQKEYDQCREQIEQALKGYFQESGPQNELLEAMRYSLLAGGKRIRPALTMKFCEAAGGRAEDALPFACGVEMLHTYSLIHDDLPCMDNDDLRRGKPTCHKVYGETIATLAGDALQAAAFRTVLTHPDQISAKAAAFLAEAAGERGMCAGQYLDTIESGRLLTEETLKQIHSHKTGALLRASCLMGVCAAERRNAVKPECFRAAGEYAEHLGIAFQIQDDLLDAVATTEQLGKPAGSDEANGKTTFVTLLGKEACVEQVRYYTQKAKEALHTAFPDAAFLDWLADWLAERGN